MKNKLYLNTPYLKHNADYSRLCMDTVWTVNEKKYEYTFFYEVEQKWCKYLVTELSDAFVLAFLEIAMEHSCDIEFVEPISEDLKYQLVRYLIPVYAQHFKMLDEISLIGPFTDDNLPTENVTGTGFSGGGRFLLCCSVS